MYLGRGNYQHRCNHIAGYELDFKTRTAGSVPSRPHQILSLYLARAHLPVLGALLDVRDEFLLLVFELGAFAVEFSLGFLEGALVFAEAFLGGHPFAEGPFDDLGGGWC